MNSKIEAALAKATGLEQDKGEKRQTWLTRLAKAVGKLEDKEWDALSSEAQDWFNTNADARNKAKKADKDLPDFTEFPDFKAEEEEEEQPRRRGAKAAEEDEAGGTGGPDILAEGQEVKITTKRGKVYEGKVTKLDTKEGFVEIDEDDEIDLDKITTVVVTKPVKAAAKPAAKKEEEPEADPVAVGAEVEVTTKRGKKIKGEITELSDDEIVLGTDDGPEEFRRDRIETIKVLKPAKKAAAKTPAAKEEKDEPAGKTRSKNAEGVSIGQRIKELIADDLDASEEAIGKLLKKEGVEFKEQTLKLNYAEVHKTVAVFKAKKLLK